MYLFILQYNGKEINRDFEKGLNRSEIYRSHSIIQKGLPGKGKWFLELMTASSFAVLAESGQV